MALLAFGVNLPSVAGHRHCLCYPSRGIVELLRQEPCCPRVGAGLRWAVSSRAFRRAIATRMSFPVWKKNVARCPCYQHGPAARYETEAATSNPYRNVFSDPLLLQKQTLLFIDADMYAVFDKHRENVSLTRMKSYIGEQNSIFEFHKISTVLLIL